MPDLEHETKRGSGQGPEAEWQSILADAVRNPAELCRILAIPELSAEDASAMAPWPMLVPRTYIARMKPGDPADPLLRQVLPQMAELAAVPGYTTDPLAEAAASCGPGLLRKYRGRALIVTTSSCGARCRFCFRRHFPFEASSAADNGEPAIDAIAADESIHEVILSGGDPLTLADAHLGRLVDQLASIPHLHRIRIHTRLPILVPQRVTDSLIRAIRRRMPTTLVVVHVNHPAEIDADVAAAFGRLIDAGIPVLSQSVLLHGVNDRADVLAEMYERLIDLRIIPYYLHRLDAVAGAAHFAVPTEVALEIVDQLRARLPGYAVPRYVRETPGGTSKEPLV